MASTSSTKIGSDINAPGIEDGNKVYHVQTPSRKRDLALAFAMLFLPMLAIPLILLAFVLYTPLSPIFPGFDPPTELALPVFRPNNIHYHYFTTIPVGSFTLVGSWASTGAQFVVAPLMLMFSFLIAKAYCNDEQSQGTDCIKLEVVEAEAEDTRQKMDGVVRAIAHGAWKDVWEGSKVLLVGRQKYPKSSAVRIATIGGLISAIFTLLLIVADNLLHTHTSSIYSKRYGALWNPNGTRALDNLTLASFDPAQICQSNITAPLSRNGTDGTNPCSLNSTSGIWTLANAATAFSTLGEGIDGFADGFILSQGDYNSYVDNLDLGTETDIQVVTYYDNNTSLSHSLLFNMTAATSYSFFNNGTNATTDPKVAQWGVDFTASTISMVTECFSATKACDISSNPNASSSNLSIPFDCSPIFSGDIWQAPSDGIEQFKGWDTRFFDNETGTAEETSISSQLNPFYFNATAALTSISFSILEQVNDPQVPRGEVVDVGNGRIATALTCKATIYNVDFSLVDGYFSYFNATVADPRLASIIKGPLQVGLGRYNLYQQAQLGILLNENVTVADYMGVAFSQIGMALSSGAFITSYANQVRERWYGNVTVVPGYALWFIVVVCFLYAAFGVAMAIIAFALSRNHKYAVKQAGLVPTTHLSIFKTIKDLVVSGFKKGRELEKSIEGSSK